MDHANTQTKVGQKKNYNYKFMLCKINYLYY